jgi:hypothetical protein
VEKEVREREINEESLSKRGRERKEYELTGERRE